MKVSSRLSSCVLLLSFLALGACSDGGNKAQQKAPAPKVGVLVVQPQTVALTQDLVGRLSAYRRADVRARVPGVLLKRDYDEGSTVKKGQLLFEIDPAPLQAAYSSAQANVAQAQANYTNAHVNAERARRLAPKGYVSKVDLDNAEAKERSAKAALTAAQAQSKSAKIQLSYTRVTSPINGRAGQQQVTEGALVGQAGATLLTTVEQLDPLYVNFTISTSQLYQLKSAQRDGSLQLSAPGSATVKIALPDGTPYNQVGKVDFSAPSVDPATGSVALRAQLPNPNFALMPGSFVNLTLVMGERHGVYLLPQRAVSRDIHGPYVLVVGSDGKVSKKTLTTVGMKGNKWVVIAGLKAGDQVIVSGLQRVQQGGTADAEVLTPDKTTQPSPSANATNQAG